MHEIEIKGWVDDVRAVRARLDAEAELVQTVTKRDLYYGPDGKGHMTIDLAEDPVFRLRNEGGGWVLTAKVRDMDEAVELNREIEFAVADVASFRAFCQHIGFRPFVVKRKRTRVYRYGRQTVELSNLDPLGDFLEAEVLLEEGASKADMAEAQREVTETLLHFGIPERRFEPRPYIDLLRKIGAGRPDVR